MFHDLSVGDAPGLLGTTTCGANIRQFDRVAHQLFVGAKTCTHARPSDIRRVFCFDFDRAPGFVGVIFKCLFHRDKGHCCLLDSTINALERTVSLLSGQVHCGIA